jgi:heat-inducible transcriptional repressor
LTKPETPHPLNSEQLVPDVHKLNDRERTILRSIVHNYILTADPVGSRALARRYHLTLSPATIRNTMSDMEELGFLAHPHTSAGRVPTSLGYRRYVDDLMLVEELTDDERRVIETHLEGTVPEAAEMSEVSKLLAFILAPDISTVTLEKVELVRVAAGRVMVVIVVSGGMVRTIMLEIASPITDTEIALSAQFINGRLSGMKLADIPRQITRRLSGDSRAASALVRLFLDFPDKIFTVDPMSDVHIGGTRQVLEQQEFRDPERVKGIIELIEDRDVIVHLMKERQPGVTVTIGEENSPEQLRGFSVITSTYRLGEASGTVGIIGPTRMNYSKLVALVEYTAKLVGEKAGS